MNVNEIALIDLSSIAYPIWMMSGSQADQNHCSTQIVARVRTLATNHPHAAICCDSGRSFRHELAPSYKANRPEREEALHHQIRLAVEQLEADGFPIWSVKGFEADDLIASAVAQALAIEGTTVLVISSDKDLLQLVGPRVRAISARDGSSFGPDEVKAKFGVAPDQMRDYLTLVGDASDNIKGAKNIGPKKAADLLARFGTLSALYREIAGPVDAKAMGIHLSVLASLREFEPHLQTTRDLVSLRTDVDLPFAEIASERVPREALNFDTYGDADMPDATHGDVFAPPAASEPASEPGHPEQPPAGPRAVENDKPTPEPTTALAVRDAEVLPAPEAWERGLDPRSMKEARVLAKDMFDSRMFSAYGTPQGVLATVMVGRELGLPAMASLRSVHNIEGKHSLSASLMVALVLKSGLAEYFEPVSFSETEATFVTKAKRARNPVTLTHTIDMARQAWPKSKADWEKSFLASGWGRNPTDMLVARATSRLARMVYPDLLAGLYTPEELIEIRESVAA
jgi:5'-3' exonuclease